MPRRRGKGVSADAARASNATPNIKPVAAGVREAAAPDLARAVQEPRGNAGGSSSIYAQPWFLDVVEQAYHPTSVSSSTGAPLVIRSRKVVELGATL